MTGSLETTLSDGQGTQTVQFCAQLNVQGLDSGTPQITHYQAFLVRLRARNAASLTQPRHGTRPNETIG